MPGTFDTILIDGRNLLCVGDAQMPGASTFLPSGRALPCGGIMGFLTGVAKIQTSLRPEEIIVCWEGRRNFRYGLFPQYKGDRAKSHEQDPDRKPRLQRQEEVLVWFLQKAGVRQVRPVDGEADDALYTLTRQERPRGHTFGVYSNDKDLWQLLSPGVVMFHGGAPDWVYTGIPEVENRIGLPISQVQEWLIGVGGKENLPGIPGVGPKKATELLSEYRTWEQAIEAAEAGELKPGVTKRLTAEECVRGLDLGRAVVPLQDAELIETPPDPDPEDVNLFVRSLGIKALMRPAIIGELRRMASRGY